LPAGPVKLAMATGAPIIPVFTIRAPRGRFRVIIDEPITVEAGPLRWDGPHPALLRLAACIERQVAAYPDQWLMLHRVWCEDRPAPARILHPRETRVLITGWGAEPGRGGDGASKWRAVRKGGCGWAPLTVRGGLAARPRHGGQAVDSPGNDDQGSREVAYLR